SQPAQGDHHLQLHARILARAPLRQPHGELLVAGLRVEAVVHQYRIAYIRNRTDALRLDARLAFLLRQGEKLLDGALGVREDPDGVQPPECAEPPLLQRRLDPRDAGHATQLDCPLRTYALLMAGGIEPGDEVVEAL